MKKVISILIVLMVSASLFASGYIGIKTGAEMTFGSIYGMTVFSNESEPTSPNMGRYDFQKYFWNVGISGANFFTNDRHHNFGLGYGIDFGFRMSTHSSLVLPENSSGLDAIGSILSNIYNAIIIEEVDVIYSPYIGAQYQYKSSDFLSIDASCGLGVQLGMAKFQASDTSVVESFYHSVYMYLGAGISITPLDELQIKAGVDFALPFYYGQSAGSNSSTEKLNILSGVGAIAIKPYLGLAYGY